MPKWLEEQRKPARRKRRERQLVGAAGLAGAGGYEAFAAGTGRQPSLTRNAYRAASYNRQASAGYKQSKALADMARTMKAPLAGTPEAKYWYAAQKLANDTSSEATRRGFTPQMRAAWEGSRRSDQRTIRNLMNSRMARRLNLPGNAFGPTGMLAMDPADRGLPKYKNVNGKKVPLRRSEQFKLARQQAAKQRADHLSHFEAAQQKRRKATAARTQRIMTERSREKVAGAARGERGWAKLRGHQSRQFARNAAKGGWRMGLAGAGAAGTAAGGIAAMKAWERRNAIKAKNLAAPGSTWASMSEEQREKALPRAIGGNRTARPVGAIGTQGKAGAYR